MRKILRAIYLDRIEKDIMDETGKKMSAYIESCRKEFWRTVFQLELEYLLKHLDGCQDILSVGCGPAIIEGELAKRGFRVTGADVSREALDHAPDSVRTIVVNAEGMSFPADSFDAVVFVVSLQFIENYPKALRQSAAALRTHGRIVAMLLNPQSQYVREKIGDPDSYISKIRHTNLEAIENAAQELFEVRAEKYLSIHGSEVSAEAVDADAALYILYGTKKPRSQKGESGNA